MTNPLEILREYERKARSIAIPLPVTEELELEWRGVAFKFAGQTCIAPLGEVKEVVTMPVLTPVPLCHDWIVGIANIRGVLIPVTHLYRYLTGSKIGMDNVNRRMLVISDGDERFGLLVDSVAGVRNLVLNRLRKGWTSCPKFLENYAKGSCDINGQEHLILSLQQLLAEQKFQDAALSEQHLFAETG